MFVEVKDPDEKVNQKIRQLPVFIIVLIITSGLNCSVSPAGDSVPAVRLRGTVHLHIAHTWRASDLPALQLLQVLPVRRRHAGEEHTSRFLYTPPFGFLQFCAVPLLDY